MVLLLIAIVIGAIIIAILIAKYFKTDPKDVFGMDIKCQNCGMEIHGLKCPRCKKDKKPFGV